jgi:hypothetical protein
MLTIFACVKMPNKYVEIAHEDTFSFMLFDLGCVVVQHSDNQLIN